MKDTGTLVGLDELTEVLLEQCHLCICMSVAESCILCSRGLAPSEVIEALAECGQTLLCASQYVQHYSVFFVVCQLGTLKGHKTMNYGDLVLKK